MRRVRTVLPSAVVAALGVAVLLAAPAPADAAWKKLECVPTPIRGAKVCLFRSTTNSTQAQGRYVNNSSYNLRTQGMFTRDDRPGTEGCANAITEAGTTSRCTRTLNGKWSVGAHTWRGDEYFGFVATVPFWFGR